MNQKLEGARVKVARVARPRGERPAKYRNVPDVLFAAIRDVYHGGGYPVRQVPGTGHYEMATRLCHITYIVPSVNGRTALMRAYAKQRGGNWSKKPICVAQYIMEG